MHAGSISLELVSLSQVVVLDWCQWGLCPALQRSSLVHSSPYVVKQILCRYIYRSHSRSCIVVFVMTTWLTFWMRDFCIFVYKGICSRMYVCSGKLLGWVNAWVTEEFGQKLGAITACFVNCLSIAGFLCCKSWTNNYNCNVAVTTCT